MQNKILLVLSARYGLYVTVQYKYCLKFVFDNKQQFNNTDVNIMHMWFLIFITNATALNLNPVTNKIVKHKKPLELDPNLVLYKYLLQHIHGSYNFLSCR